MNANNLRKTKKKKKKARFSSEHGYRKPKVARKKLFRVLPATTVVFHGFIEKRWIDAFEVPMGAIRMRNGFIFREFVPAWGGKPTNKLDNSMIARSSDARQKTCKVLFGGQLAKQHWCQTQEFTEKKKS